MKSASFKIFGEDATAAVWRSILGNAQGTVGKIGTVFKTAFAGLGVAAAAAMIGSLGAKSIEMGDALEKARQRAKLTGIEMSSLAYAAKQSDVELTGLSTGLQKMQIFLSKAESGEKANVEGLEALGIGIAQIRDLKADQQFELMADQISRLSSEEDRARAVTEVFGKAGGELLPLFQNGAAGIREAREEARKLGLVFDDETLGRLARADDAMKRLDSSWNTWWMTMTAKVAPTLAKVLDMLSGIDTRPLREALEEDIKSLEKSLERRTYGLGGGIGGMNSEREAAARAELANMRGRLALLDAPKLTEQGGGRTGRSHLPLGYAAVSGGGDDKGERELAQLSARITSTVDGIDDELIAQTQERLDDELGRELTQIEIVENARKETEDAVAEYRAQLSYEMHERQLQLTHTLSDQLMGAFKRGKDGWIDMLHFWADRLVQAGLDKLIGSIVTSASNSSSSGGSSGAGVWGSIFSSIGKMFGYAEGGSPAAGVPYLVGERGPEVRIDGPGTILPNSVLRGQRPSAQININVDARGSTEDSVKQMEKSFAELRRQIFDELGRSGALPT